MPVHSPACRSRATSVAVALAALAAVAAIAACAVLGAPAAAATDPGALQAKVDAARSQAQALAADLQAKQAQLATAQQQAAAAAAREQKLSALLATGRERSAALGRKVARSRQRLAEERRRLRRARRALAARLVAIYKSGDPDTASVILGSDDYSELVTRTAYLQEIESADRALAQRVKEIRDAVHRRLIAVADLKQRVDAYNARLAAARSQIASVRATAEAKAAQLERISSARAATLATLRSNIGSWVNEIEAARAAAARAAADSHAAAQAEVEKWLGGPYAIPTYIVMCESGGNYGAVNPSSGAGGAYQILPSTWHLYGGHGNPQDASKAEQDSIAAQIWADSGPGAWSCAG